VIASGSGGATLRNRICSFNSSGTFIGCGASVAAGSTSTTFVPTDGSAYSQSTLNRICDQTPICICEQASLVQIKVF
jgi:hypothetical protein